ncbi:mitochondrial carrier [Pluteus cervinus]|uniref:Mitochondrial carrier n=1 Tax=Pluteus cervinus TaxID=181527 RepID=A0ACD3BGI7_9AGAR|nr:mitochondrial carrier [Pluteus cervinus]
MTTPPPPSLRNLYTEPSSVWTFSPPPGSGTSHHVTSGTGTGGSTSSSVTAGAGSSNATTTPSFQWSNRPAHNSIFDLSPSLDLTSNDSSSSSVFGSLVKGGGINGSLLVKTLVASAVLQYTSSAVAMPWEVGKMLLQVQWVPRNAAEEEGEEGEHGELVGEGAAAEEEQEDGASDTSHDSESYFVDPGVPPAKRYAPRLTDEQGYVIRRSVLEEGTRPEYIIPVGTADGVWAMMKCVGTFPGEGWLSLWKGLLTSCVTEIISTTMQPFVHNFLQSLLFPNLSPFHQPPIILPVISHLFTGFVLSPLDLIRTRLVVQSQSIRHRTYSGPIDALSQILRDEGGLNGVYFHPHLFIPTVIDSTLRPLVSLALPGILASQLGSNITEETHPIAWGFAELAGSCLGLLVTLPLETARRRLQIQTRGSAKPLRTCVEVRPVPYSGVVDTIYHILTEERSDLPVRRRRRRTNHAGERREGKDGEEKEKQEEDGAPDTWLRYTGIGQLYRGLTMRLTASAVVFLLGLVSGGEEADGGWAEI